MAVVVIARRSARPPGRRLRASMAVGLAAIGLVACSPAGGERAGRERTFSLAFMGAATGEYANAVLNIVNGARLAIDEARTRGDLPGRVDVKVFDTQGDPAQAQTLKDQVVGDPSVVGVIGPAFSGESKAADPTFEQAGIPLITVASNPDLARHGWRVFHRIVANDDVQAAELARYLARGLRAPSVAYVHDDSEYGKGLAGLVRARAESEGVRSALFDAIDPRAPDYSVTVNKIRAARPDQRWCSTAATTPRRVGW